MPQLRPTYLRQHVDHDKLKDTLAFSWPTVREVTWPLRQGYDFVIEAQSELSD